MLATFSLALGTSALAGLGPVRPGNSGGVIDRGVSALAGGVIVRGISALAGGVIVRGTSVFTGGAGAIG